MPIVFHNGKLLFTADGKLAMSEDCCCCLDAPIEKKLYVTYMLSRIDLPANTSYSTATGYVLNAVHTINAIGGPGAHSTSTPNSEEMWVDGRCGGVGDFAYIKLVRTTSGDTEGTAPILVSEEYSAKLFRRGSVFATVWPAILMNCRKTCPDPNTSCPDSEKTCHDYDDKWLWYATDFKYSFDNTNWTTHQTGWNSSTYSYGAYRPWNIDMIP